MAQGCVMFGKSYLSGEKEIGDAKFVTPKKKCGRHGLSPSLDDEDEGPGRDKFKGEGRIAAQTLRQLQRFAK